MDRSRQWAAVSQGVADELAGYVVPQTKQVIGATEPGNSFELHYL